MESKRPFSEQFSRHPLVALFVLTLLTSGAILLPGWNLYRWDTLIYNWPLTLEVIDQWRQGHLPLWSDAFGCGTPLLENVNAAVLYPLRVLFLGSPLQTGYAIYLFIHMFLAALGMYLLLREAGLRRSSSLVGAMVYGLSGYTRSMWDTHNFTALPWIPLGMASLLMARKQGYLFRSIALTALAWSLLILGGDIQAAVLWCPAAILLAIFYPERKRLLVACLAALGLGLLLTAPQWLSTLYYLPETWRATGLDSHESLERSFHPLRLIEVGLPYAFGTHDQWFGAGLAGAGAEKTTPWVSSFHCGILALLALLSALFLRRRNRLFPWAILLAVGGIVLAFGRFLPGFEFWQNLPVIRGFRYPEKYLLWSTVGLSVLSALGWDRLRALMQVPHANRFQRRLLIVWALLIFIAIASAYAFGRQLPTTTAALFKHWLGLSLLHPIIIMLVVFPMGFSQAYRRILLPGLGIVLLIDLIWGWMGESPLTHRINPLSPPAVVQSIHPAHFTEDRFYADPALMQIPLPTDFLTLSSSEQSTTILKESLSYNSPRLWSLSAADGFFPLESAAMTRFRQDTIRPSDHSVPSIEHLATFCRATSVRWLLISSQRTQELAKAGVKGQLHASWGAEKEVQLLKLDTPSLHIAARELSSANQNMETTALPLIGVTEHLAPGHQIIHLTPGRESALEISRTAARGWHAYTQDGIALHPALSDQSTPFQRWLIPAGTTSIELRYRPRGLTPGMYGAGIGLILLIFLGLFSRFPSSTKQV